MHVKYSFRSPLNSLFLPPSSRIPDWMPCYTYVCVSQMIPTCTLIEREQLQRRRKYRDSVDNLRDWERVVWLDENR